VEESSESYNPSSSSISLKRPKREESFLGVESTEGPALGVGVLEGRPPLGIVRPKRNYGAACGWPATHGLAKASGEVVCRGVGASKLIRTLQLQNLL